MKLASFPQPPIRPPVGLSPTMINFWGAGNLPWYPTVVDEVIWVVGWHAVACILFTAMRRLVLTLLLHISSFAMGSLVSFVCWIIPGHAMHLSSGGPRDRRLVETGSPWPWLGLYTALAECSSRRASLTEVQCGILIAALVALCGSLFRAQLVRFVAVCLSGRVGS